jgi:hypothetical protein
MKLRLESLELRENPSVVVELPQLEVGMAFVDGPPSIDDPGNWNVPGPFVPPPPPPPPILENPVTPGSDKFPLPPPVPTGPG